MGHASAEGTWILDFGGVLQHEGGLSLKGSSGRMSPQRQDPLLHNDARLSNKRERERERRDDDKTEETERQNDASGDWKTRTKEDNKEVADGGRWLKEAEEAM